VIPLAYAFCLLATACSAAGEKAPVPTAIPSKSEAIERLKKIEDAVRARKEGADAEVEKTREETQKIIKDGEEKSAKIKAEADEYNARIQQEIEDIQKKGSYGLENRGPGTGAPSREQLTGLMASLVDPLFHCWEPRIPRSLRPKPAGVERCVMERVRKRLGPHFKD